ncbi:MAG: tetratricopeptide repeat protein [Phycisphaerales bacterium]|nr:tetratricopeptide repeat protein [Phycisphaerales bacterium]MCB9835592.1 tetratricopeptide repeat protein [Phycisphaera sp.]
MKRASMFVSACLLSIAACTSAAQDTPAQPITPTMQEANAALQGGDPTKAAEMFKAICDANPKAAQAWFMQGYALHMAGNIDEAIPVHQKAATFPQLRPQALYNLGCAYALNGEADDAFGTLRLALDAGQATVEQVTGDTDLTSLHEDPRWEPLVERLRVARENAPASAMHFWVGQWDCYSPNGVLSGTNHLELVNNDMFIHEQWTNAQGQEGQSFNYYDIEHGVWRQIWVDPGRQLEMTAEPTTPGRLLFEGENYDQAGNRSLRRMLVQKLDGGRVLQEGRASNDEGKTWTIAYRLVYMPKGEPFNGEGLPEPGA